MQCKSETENFHLNVKASLLKCVGCSCKDMFHLTKFHYGSESTVVSVCKQITIFHANHRRPLQFVCDQSNYNEFFSAAHSLQVISPSVSIFLQPEESPSAGHYKQSQLSGTSHQLYFSNQVAVAIFHLQTLIYDSCHYYWTAHVWTLLGLMMHKITWNTWNYMIRNIKTLKKGLFKK